jgi:hypothetical protein
MRIVILRSVATKDLSDEGEPVEEDLRSDKEQCHAKD